MRKPDKGRRVFCHLDTKIGTLGYVLSHNCSC
jgi:hypothetical protein